MRKDEKKYLKIAGLLYVVLILLIFLGSFFLFLLNHSWYGRATVIAVIFVWVTVFLIATIVATRAFSLIKERLRGKERLDFTARLGAVIADYIKDGTGPDLLSFFREVCKENGVVNTPDLKKYFDDNKLIGDRESVFEKIRQEIEESADDRSKEKK